MRTLSEATVFLSVPETALGTADTSLWRTHRPNSLTKFGAMFKTVQANPMGAGRQLQAGQVVDLEAPVEWTADLSKDLIDSFANGIMMSGTKHNGGSGLAFFRPTSVTSSGYVVGASGAVPDNTLLFGRGFSVAGNNGLKPAAGTSTGVLIKASGLAAETVSVNGTSLVEVAGYRGASGDITMNGSGNLTSTLADFTTMGLVVGQWIWVGGTLAGSNAFATAAYRGFAQVKIIAAALLTLQRRQWTVGSLDSGSGKLIDIYFGRWLRSTTAQHADYLETSYTFEATYQTLGGVSTPEYEYSVGQYLSQTVINLPPGDKATVDLTFIGQNTTDPSTTRLTGASATQPAVATAMYVTAVGLLRLRCSNTDETGLSTDVKNLKITMSNNVTREVILGTLGAKYLNVGEFSASIDGDFLFTSHDIVAAVRDQRQFQFDCGIRNGDGGFLIDMPAMQLKSTDRDFTANESVKIKGAAGGFMDPTLGYTCGITIFPYLPSA